MISFYSTHMLYNYTIHSHECWQEKVIPYLPRACTQLPNIVETSIKMTFEYGPGICVMM